MVLIRHNCRAGTVVAPRVGRRAPRTRERAGSMERKEESTTRTLFPSSLSLSVRSSEARGKLARSRVLFAERKSASLLIFPGQRIRDTPGQRRYIPHPPSCIAYTAPATPAWRRRRMARGRGGGRGKRWSERGPYRGACLRASPSSFLFAGLLLQPCLPLNLLRGKRLKIYGRRITLDKIRSPVD